MDQKEIRCISVEKEAKRYFDKVTAKEIGERKTIKTGYLLGLVEYYIDRYKVDGVLLVIPAGEIAQLLRDAMEMDGRTSA